MVVDPCDEDFAYLSLTASLLYTVGFNAMDFLSCSICSACITKYFVHDTAVLLVTLWCGKINPGQLPRRLVSFIR